MFYTQRGVVKSSMKNISESNLIFPRDDIPPCFDSSGLYEMVKLIEEKKLKYEFKYNYKVEETGKIKQFITEKDKLVDTKKATEPITLYVSKNDGNSRKLSIPNPSSSVPLHLYVTENIEAILKEENDDEENYRSSSKYYYDDMCITASDIYGEEGYIDTAFIQQKYYQEHIHNQYEISNGKYYRLFIDISDFYNSIYTHQISSNLKKSENKLIFDNLDVLMRSMNGNETKGILIGPYTCGLFAELIFSKIDREIKELFAGTNISYVRYVDDMSFYSDKLEELQGSFRYEVEKIISKYKLILNSTKTNIREFPYLPTTKITSVKIEDSIKKMVNDKDSSDFDLMEEMMGLINEYNTEDTRHIKHILSIYLTNIKDGKINLKKWPETNITILLDYLFNLVLKRDVYTKKAIPLIVEILAKVNRINREELVTKWLKKRELQNSNVKEIVDIWLMYVINLFNLTSDKITNYAISLIDTSELGAILVIDYLVKIL